MVTTEILARNSTGGKDKSSYKKQRQYTLPARADDVSATNARLPGSTPPTELGSETQ